MSASKPLIFPTPFLPTTSDKSTRLDLGWRRSFLSRLQQVGVLPGPWLPGIHNSIPGVHAPIPGASADDHVPVWSVCDETGSSSAPSSLRRNQQWGNHLEGKVKTPVVGDSRLVGGTSVAARSL